ncbi:MAG TPA: single-stranded-DNA-specific exonuclease RecJ [Candidatus Hydrogenedentes bacterium]|nr:single-stranded-DNA-specific exonuclease RecJ [Candidatus Hydrogenedentota bacterium]HOL77572.1 single-stranded-DNA-specific exonuclease RecJ [Candidatus Hydrogenedentota bacterium]HPO84877.1 single-stranded-DNA-specific exonuclease RecJ [Candidatus Hydrogenedentota bacterium]
MKREWQIAKVDRAKALSLARALNVPPLIAHVLLARGINTIETAKRFLNPAIEHIGDPFLFNEMEKAVERVNIAIQRNENVLIFGDYDVDGVSGTALLVKAFRRLGLQRCQYDVPNRFTEGFGLSPSRVRRAHQEGVTLIITVDNGSSAQDAADEAKKLGIDLIVTDHHPTKEPLSNVTAFLNSACEPSSHVSANACGVGIAYKLAWALTGEPADLDLVALGTVADVVPLQGENRDFVAVGLQWAAREAKPGIDALARVSGLALEKLRSEDIAYHLAPRINAAGRLSSAHKALDLLLTDSPSDALRLARELDEANEERKRLETAILEEASEMLVKELEQGKKAVVLGSRSWHPGVAGIVAARIQTRYGVPAIIVVFGEDGLGRGSARGVDGINLAEVLAQCEEYLVTYGGHKAAAGVTIREEALDKFRDRFEEAVAVAMPGKPSPAPLSIDAVISLSEIEGKLIRAIEKLAPFGHGNPMPVFLCQGVRVLKNSLKELRNDSIRFVVQDGPRLFPAVGFRLGDRAREIASADKIDVAFSLQIDSWRGESTVQLRIRDFRVLP